MFVVLMLLVALGCFLAAAFGVSPARVNLIAAGLSFVVIAELARVWP